VMFGRFTVGGGVVVSVVVAAPLNPGSHAARAHSATAASQRVGAGGAGV